MCLSKKILYFAVFCLALDSFSPENILDVIS